MPSSLRGLALAFTFTFQHVLLNLARRFFEALHALLSKVL
jgi:hypothetical protein